jgi:group I intron endonuclease
MTIYSIYKIENLVTSKAYVGFTSNRPDVRWKRHIYVSKNPKTKQQSHIHRALNKYGVDQFAFTILYQSKDGEHTLNVMEPHFIQEYDTINNGYNVTTGGEGTLGYSHTDESKAVMSKRATGRKHTEEIRAEMSATRKGRGVSSEARTKMSDSRSRDWIVVHPDGTEEQIKNMKDFCKRHNLVSCHMSSVAKGKLKAHKGFTCRTV